MLIRLLTLDTASIQTYLKFQSVNSLRQRRRLIYRLAQETVTIIIADSTGLELRFSCARGAATLDRIVRDIKSRGDQASMGYLSSEFWTRVAKSSPDFFPLSDKITLLGIISWVGHLLHFLQITTDASSVLLLHSVVSFTTLVASV